MYAFVERGMAEMRRAGPGARLVRVSDGALLAWMSAYATTSEPRREYPRRSHRARPRTAQEAT